MTERSPWLLVSVWTGSVVVSLLLWAGLLWGATKIIKAAW
jgi:hypothetical protein